MRTEKEKSTTIIIHRMYDYVYIENSKDYIDKALELFRDFNKVAD